MDTIIMYNCDGIEYEQDFDMVSLSSHLVNCDGYSFDMDTWTTTVYNAKTATLQSLADAILTGVIETRKDGFNNLEVGI